MWVSLPQCPSSVLRSRFSHAAVAFLLTHNAPALACPVLWWSLWRSTSYFKARVCLRAHLWLPIPDMFEKSVSTWFSGAINRATEKVSALFGCNLFRLSRWLQSHFQHVFWYHHIKWSDVMVRAEREVCQLLYSTWIPYQFRQPVLWTFNIFHADKPEEVAEVKTVSCEFIGSVSHDYTNQKE